MATVLMLLSACGSSSTAAHSSPFASGMFSPQPTVTPPPAKGLMVLVVQKQNGPVMKDMLELVDTQGHVAGHVEFSAPARAFVGNCASIPPPAVRVAAGAVFFADSTGVIHRMSQTGSISQVARFPISSTSFLSFAVSPDGQRLIAIVFNTPTPLDPIPPLGTDPFVATGHWTLDLETAITGGPTTNVLHKDYGHSFPSGGPTFIAGWDDAGPLATLNTYACAQNAVPSVEYVGSPLIHLGLDGTHLDQIGGAGCTPWDELDDGTILCGGSDWSSFSVRTRTGTVLWSRAVGSGIINEPRLSPDGRGVTVNGDHVAIYLRDSATPASSVRTSPPAEALLGWVGSDYVLVVRAGTPAPMGLVPVADTQTFIALGTLPTQPEVSFAGPNMLVGTLGI